MLSNMMFYTCTCCEIIESSLIVSISILLISVRNILLPLVINSQVFFSLCSLRQGCAVIRAELSSLGRSKHLQAL